MAAGTPPVHFEALLQLPFITPAYGLSGCCSSFLFIQFPGATPSAIWSRLAKNVMYEHFFNSFGLRENPFHVSPDPRFYFPTRAQESALTELLFGVETRQGLMVLTGEAGTGKTTLLNQFLDWLQRRGRSSAYVFHALLEPLELLQFILRDFGVSCSSNHKGDVVDALYSWLRARNAAGDLPVLILDEAQALPKETLDELRLLLNLETPRGKLLQIILSGQPELDEKLRLPALRQLRQRIMFHSRILLFTQEETAAYIARRLATAGRADSSLFPPEVVEAIYASSRGIPRVVNLLSEHALISAYAEQQHVISPEMIRRIAVDFDLLAEPLTVKDPQGQPHFEPLVPFPAVGISEPFAVSQRAVKLDPVPVVSRPVSVESSGPRWPANAPLSWTRFRLCLAPFPWNLPGLRWPANAPLSWTRFRLCLAPLPWNLPSLQPQQSASCAVWTTGAPFRSPSFTIAAVFSAH